MTHSTVFLPQGVYSPVLRNNFLAADGAQLNMNISAGGMGSFEVSLTVGKGDLDARNDNLGIKENFAGQFMSMPAPFAGAIIQVDSSNLQQTDVAGITWNTPLEGLRIKGSIVRGANLEVTGRGQPAVQFVTLPSPPFPAGTDVSTAFTFDVRMTQLYVTAVGAEYQRGNWTFASEWAHIYAKVQSSFVAADLGTNLQSVTYTSYDGAYINAAYRFLPAWEGVLGFNVLNKSDRDPTTDDRAGRQRGVSAALRWDVTDHFLLKAEYQRNHGSGLASSTDLAVKPWESYWNLYAVKATLDF